MLGAASVNLPVRSAMSSADTPTGFPSEKFLPHEQSQPLPVSRTPSASKKSVGSIDIEKVSRDESSESSHEDKAKHNRSKRQTRIGLIHLCTVSITLFNLGWNDGTSGPLLPRLQSVYDVRPDPNTHVYAFTYHGIDRIHNRLLALYSLMRGW